MNTENYYGGELYSVEKATLAEDLQFKDFKKVTAKFFIEIMTPGNEIGYEDPKVVNRGSYKKSNYVTLDIPAYVLFNCVQPSIRTLYVDASGYLNINNGRPVRVFSMDFKQANSTAYIIPKGTEFLIQFLTGSTSIEDYRIVGTNDPYPQVKEV